MKIFKTNDHTWENQHETFVYNIENRYELANGDGGAIEMRLGEIEPDIGDAPHQRLQPRVGIGSDKLGQLLRLPVGKSLPGLRGGRHDRLSSNG